MNVEQATRGRSERATRAKERIDNRERERERTTRDRESADGKRERERERERELEKPAKRQ